jgi:hypothetical protein
MIFLLTGILFFICGLLQNAYSVKTRKVIDKCKVIQIEDVVENAVQSKQLPGENR